MFFTDNTGTAQRPSSVLREGALNIKKLKEMKYLLLNFLPQLSTVSVSYVMGIVLYADLIFGM